MLIMATTAIVSCTPGSGKNPFGKKVLATTIKVKASDDLIAASDIEITYKGEGGIDVTDTITSTYWMKRVFNDTFPTVIGRPEYRLLIKPDAKFDNDRCDLTLSISYMNPLKQWEEQLIDIDDVASSKVAAYLEAHEQSMSVLVKKQATDVYKVYIKDGDFECDHILNPEQLQEPSKETER